MATGRGAVLAVGCLLGLAGLAALAGCAPPPAGGAGNAATGANAGTGANAATPGRAAAAAAAGASCGKTRTGADVPAVIKVAKGPVDCAAALRAEQGYAAAIRSGRLRGNGGGAPVGVDGWTCQTYPTSQVLRTGEASECHTASAEVVAELSLPSSSSSA